MAPTCAVVCAPDTPRRARGLAWALLLCASPWTAWAAPEDDRSLAVFPVQARLGVHPDLAELVSEHVLQQARRAGAFGRVMSPAEIAQLMPANERQTVMDCASDECALIDNELAGALGATHILAGNVSRLEQSSLLALKLFDLKRALVISSVSLRVPGTTAEALLDATRPAVAKLMMLAAMNRFPTAAVFPLGAKLGTPPELAEQFTAAMVGALQEHGAFDVVLDPAEISEHMTPEQQGVVTACEGDECAVVDEDLVGGLGVTHVLLGNVARGDTSWVVTGRLIQVKTGVAVATLSERVPADDGALLAFGVPAARALLGQAGMLAVPAVLVPAFQAAEPTSSGARGPLFGAAGGAGGLGAMALIVGVVAAVGGAVALAFYALPALNRPFVSSLSLPVRAAVLQVPPVGLLSLAAVALLVGTAALSLSGVSALAGWRAGG